MRQTGGPALAARQPPEGNLRPTYPFVACFGQQWSKTIPAAENALTHYQRAEELFKQHVLVNEEIEGTESGDFLQSVVYNYHPADTATVEYIRDETAEAPDRTARESLDSFLARHQEQLQELRAGAAQKTLYIDRSVQEEANPNGEIRFPLYGHSAGLLSLDARWQLSQGHVGRAVQDANALFAGGRQVTKCYGFIGELVACSDFAIGVGHVIQPILNDPQVNAEALAQIELPPAFWLEMQFGPAMVFDEDKMVGKIAQFPAWDWNGFSQKGRGHNEFYEHWYAGSLVRMLAMPDALVLYRYRAAECRSLTNVPYCKRNEEAVRNFAKATPAHLRFERVGDGGDLTGWWQITGGDAYVSAAAAAVAVVRYRLSHGKYPARLEDCVPEFLAAVPTDPCDGQPIRMKALEGGMILYSVGSDGKDDGGQDEYGLTGDENSDNAVYLGSAYQDHLERVRKQQEKWDRR